ncbi:alcohol dehydrogenase family protein [Phytoactinopolyspora halotolerans]|uniref:Zinc-binding dehydrogenase n=1 Tax=Phytoactinopolyspora halotolerans TaxID=1981512 RepID=A0A6L9SAD3_9ACTN|nr:zinc-binding dehydrogenase [Phytoactinopolyspora halotolerans]
MHAVLLTGFGGPEKLEYREDVPDPQAGPGEVRLRVGAAALNNTDIWTREGAYGSSDDPSATTGWRRESLRFPRIQGADVAGLIDQVGPGVPESRIGERVLVDPMIYDGGERELVVNDYLGSERDGGFAEFVTVPAGNAHAVDTPLSDAELATFPTAYTTAMRMLNRAKVQSGETVLVTGASGGVGSALIQLATVRGAQVVAVASAAKHDRAREMGAVAVVDRAGTDLVADVQEALQGRPLDVAADVVAGPSFSAQLDLLRPLGRYVVAGAMAGPIVQTDLRTVYLKQLQLIGSSFGSHEDFAQMLAHITAGELRPLLAKTFPLRDLREAQRHFKEKNFFGKIVVTPAGPAEQEP